MAPIPPSQVPTRGLLLTHAAACRARAWPMLRLSCRWVSGRGNRQRLFVVVVLFSVTFVLNPSSSSFYLPHMLAQQQNSLVVCGGAAQLEEGDIFADIHYLSLGTMRS